MYVCIVFVVCVVFGVVGLLNCFDAAARNGSKRGITRSVDATTIPISNDQEATSPWMLGCPKPVISLLL